MRKFSLSAAKARTGSTSRRRFLGGVGASALATSAVLFGSAERASALAYACCNLALVPSVTVSTCLAASCHYNWYCSTSTRTCSCCEVKSCSTGSFTKSAYRCDGS